MINSQMNYYLFIIVIIVVLIAIGARKGNYNRSLSMGKFGYILGLMFLSFLFFWFLRKVNS